MKEEEDPIIDNGESECQVCGDWAELHRLDAVAYCKDCLEIQLEVIKTEIKILKGEL